MAARLKNLVRDWQASSIGSECTLHQLAPYIGKLKTTVASSLLETYSRERDIIIDPFCGSGVVALEALLRKRSVVANDINPYAAVLTRAKMFPIVDEWQALARATQYLERAKALAKKKNYQVSAPRWVRRFFHPKTFAEVKILADLLRRKKEWFLLANLLGILHHQRPGFLSYPCSHLVPYLRKRKFPREQYPELYRYRDPEIRLTAKLLRTYERFAPIDPKQRRSFRHGDIRRLSIRCRPKLALTSPPYMNALDYGRDNRLRLWFLGIRSHRKLDHSLPRDPKTFSLLMEITARKLRSQLAPRGKAVLVVGELRRSRQTTRIDRIVRTAFEENVGGWKLIDQVSDAVPDIRRSRRSCRGTKKEWVMVFAKTR